MNYDGNFTYGSGRKGEYRQRTVAVNALPANSWGLHQMHGNVWEWCWDWYGPYEAGPVTDPRGPATGTSRVLRGGSWGSYPRGCRAAGRLRGTPGLRHSGSGFRLALDPRP